MHSHTVLQYFFYWQKFHEKMKLKIKKFENEVFFFKVFNCLKWEGKKSLYWVFQFVAKYNIGMIQDLYHELQTGDFCYLHMGSTIMSAISISRHLCVCVCVRERERERERVLKNIRVLEEQVVKQLDTWRTQVCPHWIYICLASSRCFFILALPTAKARILCLDIHYIEYSSSFRDFGSYYYTR
jgi:hypothetical protein